ncbi:MAG TPA: aldo/keto reductase [Methylomirabilota bacterium]|nr:aldo/keto reductase [Methylomirabilota bacterium]
MKTRALGRGGLVVSAIGLGPGSATTSFGERDDAEQIATMRRALDLGVNFFDTSDAYSGGRHEQLIGQAIQGRRHEVVLASKFGNLDLPGGKKGYNGRPDYVPRACEASLRRLGVDIIDLYYLHRIDPDVPIEDTVGAMAQLVRAGKVRYLGLSEAGPKSLERANRIHPIAALQTEYSLWARHVEAEILPACRRLGTGFVAYSPLGRGLLTGNIRRLDDIAPHDRRRIHPRFHPRNLERNLELVHALERIGAAHDLTAAQVALAWLLSRGDDVVPIPGTKQRRYVEANAAAVDVALSPEELEQLSEVFRPGAVAGERYPPGYFTTLGA